nr:CNNM domain-containing protein [uncultured Carboxylicivirga sp.]
MELSVFFTWIGIGFCLSQSALFSGLNLAFFSFTRLRLEIEAEGSSSKGAQKVLKMRKDSNFLLTTILWGNVGINVLLTLLTDSVLTGLLGFMFSTVVITLFGEIVPQAYFSRNSLKMASLLAPVLRIYQFILFPVAKPSAILLDAWLGKESIEYFKEKKIKYFLKKHVDGADSEIDRTEGIGAINFLSLDDILVSKEGEPLHPKSIIPIAHENGMPVFPKFTKQHHDLFLRQINESKEKWVVFVDENLYPTYIMDADGFLRAAMFDGKQPNPINFIHKPIIITNSDTVLGDIIHLLSYIPEHMEDDVVDQDVILLWSDVKHVITGADILGRLLRGIVKKQTT